jgi:hypothetical protein
VYHRLPDNRAFSKITSIFTAVVRTSVDNPCLIVNSTNEGGVVLAGPLVLAEVGGGNLAGAVLALCAALVEERAIQIDLGVHRVDRFLADLALLDHFVFPISVYTERSR